MNTPHRVPPAPDVMAILFREYQLSGKADRLTFPQYLASIGYSDPAIDVVGMDDAARFVRGAAGPELIDIPARPVTGRLMVKVLLVDFPDRPGTLPPAHYADMLFSEGVFPTGSMRDFYKEVSLGTGSVSTTFPGGRRSGVALENITVNPANGAITVDLKIAKTPAGGGPSPASRSPNVAAARNGRGSVRSRRGSRHARAW